MSLQIVQEVRAKYPTPLKEYHDEFLLEVAARLGMGLLRKDWGTFVRLPDGTGVAQDVLVFQNLHTVDILIDGENEARPQWALHEGDGVPIERYYAVQPAPQPQPQPIPDPIEPPVVCKPDLSVIEDALEVINSRIDTLEFDINTIRAQQDAYQSENATQIDDLQNAVAELTEEVKSIKRGAWVGRIFGVKVVLRFE